MNQNTSKCEPKYNKTKYIRKYNKTNTPSARVRMSNREWANRRQNDKTMDRKSMNGKMQGEGQQQ